MAQSQSEQPIRPSFWTQKICKIKASWAVLDGFGPLFHILSGSWYFFVRTSIKGILHELLEGSILN